MAARGWKFRARLRAVLPVDGVFLALHGAMILEDEPDAEAEIVRRVRAELKPGTPITVSLDLHGHITAAMLQPNVAYIGYREFPHIDMYETGHRATCLLIDWIAGKVKPVMDSMLPLADAAKAHARMESSAHIGKIALIV